jgi:hypothetical protein
LGRWRDRGVVLCRFLRRQARLPQFESGQNCSDCLTQRTQFATEGPHE